MCMKEKMDELKRMKLIYSAELFFFAIVGVVLGVLFLLGIIAVKDWKKWTFTIVTLLGGIWLVTDFIWTLRSKKRRAKSSLFDKALVVPSGLTLFVLDIYALVHLIPNKDWVGNNGNFFRYVIGIALCYLAVVYTAQGIYHLFVTHPSLIEALEEDRLEQEKKNQEAIKKAEALEKDKENVSE